MDFCNLEELILVLYKETRLQTDLLPIWYFSS